MGGAPKERATARSGPGSQVTGRCSSTIPVVLRPSVNRKPAQGTRRLLDAKRQGLDPPCVADVPAGGNRRPVCRGFRAIW